MAVLLKRPTALFFLPKPPETSGSASLRDARGAAGRRLTPNERVKVRWALNRQREASELIAENTNRSSIAPIPRGGRASQAAGAARDWLGVSVDDQTAWSDTRDAFFGWKDALERRGVFVLQLEFGLDGIQGFSSWDENAPIIGVNNSSDREYEVRCFSIWHEIGHLIRRDSAACARFSPSSRDVEAWCDHFAATALLPEEAVREFVAGLSDEVLADEIKVVSRTARKFSVSLTATSIRLSDIELVDTEVVGAIIGLVTRRRTQKRGKGGGGSTTIEKRHRELGPRLINVFFQAHREGKVGELDIADYLDVKRGELDDLAASLGEPVA
jgi:Zn-dependent peptidase ImmA (M78 family)